ncbi:16S rRNA (guanine(966)-N(2))-methyltransferase RsmD, partial [Dysosmobacter welbionis]
MGCWDVRSKPSTLFRLQIICPAHCLHICGGDPRQVLPVDGRLSRQTARLPDQDLLKQVSHAPGVAEGGRIRHPPFQQGAQRRLRLRLQNVAPFFTLHPEDGQQFLRRVICKVEEAVEPGLQSRIGVDELVHQPVVARDDHHQVVPVVLHGLQQRVDGLLAEVVGPAAVEGVCLVDEQHTPQSGVDDLP